MLLVKLVNKIILLFVIIILSVNIIGVDKIILAFFYVVNGSKLQIDNNYTIKLSFSHWAYYNENNFDYFLIGRKVNNSNLTAEFYKNSQNIDISKFKKICKNENLINNGIILICHKKNRKDDIIFQSYDKNIVMRGIDINASDKKVIKEYILLLRN